MNLHSRALRYLDEVARCGSIRKAASRLHIASSAVNRRILMLEEELGTPIFERHPNQLRLTAAGEVLIHHVRRTLQDQERAESEIEDLRGMRRGRVNLAVIEGVAAELLPAVLAKFHETYPKISFSIEVTPSALVPAMVASGDAHIGISFNSPVMKGVRRVTSASMDIGVVMRPDHPLSKAKVIRLRDCIQYPICMAGSTLSIAPLIGEAMAESGLDAEPFVICNSAEAMKAIVRDGAGIMFKSGLGVEREVANRELVFKRLKERISEKLYLIEKTGRKLPVAASALQEYLRDAIAATEARLR